MSVDQRKSALYALHSSYVMHREFGEACQYCGQRADTVDHVPPLAMAYGLGRDGMEREKISPVLVSACRECNGMLNRSPILEISKRKAIIKNKLRRKYAKYLTMPSWTDDELAELGSGLRQKIVDAQALKDWIRRRVAW